MQVANLLVYSPCGSKKQWREPFRCFSCHIPGLLPPNKCLNAVMILGMVRPPHKTHLASKLHLATTRQITELHSAALTKNASSESCSTVAILDRLLHAHAQYRTKKIAQIMKFCGFCTPSDIRNVYHVNAMSAKM